MIDEQNNGSPVFDLSVCICTFRRPELLRRLLHAVLQQEQAGLKFGIVVVDNDPAASASAVLAEMQASFPQRIQAIHLNQANISLARNAAIHAASGQWLAFIDDDEVPESLWLHHLLRSQQQYQADVVFGPVLAEYAEGVADWLRQGRYFDRRRLPSGTRIGETDARSGNALIRRQSLLDSCDSANPESGPFDVRYGKTGGEDSILFRKLGANGAVMVWCDEAPVYEWIPLERAQARWLLQRSFRIGQLYIRAELEGLPAPKKIKRLLWLECRALLQGLVALGLSLALAPFFRLKAFSWLRIACAQMGKLSYLFAETDRVYG